jgi:hypothetical protein
MGVEVVKKWLFIKFDRKPHGFLSLGMNVEQARSIALAKKA